MPPPQSIIFHHPLPVEVDPRVGSTTHVTRMLHGFEQAGFDVEVVAGFSKDRVRSMRRVRAEMDRGRVFQFAFAEASTAPTSLNDPRHMPTHPMADWQFLRALRRQGVPVGLFYPDVHWRFPFYRAAVSRAKRHIAAAFYRYDLAWYHDAVDLLFMPSSGMRRSVPGWRNSASVIGLSPGGVIDPLPLRPRAGQLHLFYVGSITPPLYDISDLVRAVNEVAGVFLSVCCPPGERALASAISSDRITVVHEHGEALRDRYQRCDIACLVYTPEPYRVFAMPVKMFEAIGYGRPVLTGPGTSASEFITSSGMGWVVDPSSLTVLLRSLLANSDLVRDRHAAVLAQQEQHSWRSRAQFVADCLLADPESRPPCPTERIDSPS